MKNIFKYLLGLVTLVMFAACSPESFEGANGDIPSIDGVDPVITVDQTLNQVTFTLPADQKGVMPIWYFESDKSYSTVNGQKKIFTKAGDYTVTFKLMNRNGISDGSKTVTFHIDNTIMNFDKYTKLLCGGLENAAKEWRIDNSKPAHLGCGEPGTTGTNWWSAAADDKAGTGLYDNRLTFGSDNSYKFNPGDNGTMYVNYGTTALNTTGATADFSMPVSEMTTTYEFDVDGDDLYLVLPEHTYFPYIANDDVWNTPRYKVESITADEINLVSDNGAIAWHYILTSGADTTFKGYKYNSDYNMWKPIDEQDAYTTHFWYAPGWNQIADPGFAKNGSEYTFTLPEATTDQWMAQCPIKPNEGMLHLTTSSTYDFSCTLNSSTDINGVTVKLTDVNTGDNYVFVERVDLKAYEDKVFYISDVNNLTADADCELFFDFGGNPANTTVSVKNIVVKDHANDDGTVLPSDDPSDSGNTATMDWDASSSANLWKAVEDGSAFVSVTPWFADNNWSQIADPAWTHENGEWNVTLTDGMGGSQWQGQFPINTTLTASGSKKYNFYLVMEADNDCPGVTIKLTESDDADGTKHDGNYFFADRHDIKAFEPFIYKAEGVTLAQGTDAHALSLFFDFGGSPAGTNVKISKIYFEETTSMDYEDADNLWKAVDSGDAFISVTPWFADNNWSQIGDPEWSHDGRDWTLVIPDAMGGSQWQGQFPINTTLTATQADTYNFSCTLETDNDAPGVTIKLTESDDASKHDDNYFFADRHDIAAYTPYVYTVKNVQLPKNDAHALSLFFDFGGTPAGTNVKITNIVFKKNGSSAKRYRARRR